MNETTELLTLRDYLRWAVSCFIQAGLSYGHGTDNVWDEALSLVLPTLHLPHGINPAVLDARLLIEERERLYQVIQRRIKERIPVAYLTHEAWFAGLAFYVDERVLVPRSPIAELIENHFKPWIDPDHVNQILDICTGSGCIAVACAMAFPEAEIDASDISADALAVAKINLLRHQVEQQVHLIQADVFKGLEQKQYDIIVTNPPYVDAEDMADLPAEYNHEPKIGLEAGKDGLKIVLTILQQARSYLRPQGILIVEVGNSEFALMEKFPHVPFTWLQFQHSDGGVFLLTAEQLDDETFLS